MSSMKNSEQEASPKWWESDPEIDPGQIDEVVEAELERMSEAMRNVKLPPLPPNPNPRREGEPFNLDEMVQDMVDSFNRTAAERTMLEEKV